jgi:hypothetical protein
VDPGIVDVTATAIDALTPDGETEAHADPAAAPSPTTATAKPDRDPIAGLDADHQRIVAEFECSIGMDPDQDAEDDADDSHGARGGDHREHYAIMEQPPSRLMASGRDVRSRARCAASTTCVMRSKNGTSCSSDIGPFIANHSSSETPSTSSIAIQGRPSSSTPKS